MSDKLNRSSVLVLNRNWQPINTVTPKVALVDMAKNVATAFNIDGDKIYPVKWDEWLALPVRDNEEFVATSSRKVRMPTVILCCSYSKVPKKRPRFSRNAIWERDKGTCQYTGKKLSKKEGNIDHVHPVSRGGKTTWKNCVLAHKDVNSKKANQTPEEAGLKLLRKPDAPAEIPVIATIRNNLNISDWNYFLIS